MTAAPARLLESTAEVNPDRELLDFQLPGRLEANEPPEARGLARDQVRLLVTHYREEKFIQSRFSSLPDFFKPGDILVINTSGTLKAALHATREDGNRLELHISTNFNADLLVVELRKPAAVGSDPYLEAKVGERLNLPGGASVRLLQPYRANHAENGRVGDKGVRLWVASADLPTSLLPYLDRFGFPIRYKYVRTAWPIEYYQTVYADEPGSAEMPSAGRAFTEDLIGELKLRGVQLTPIVLHTGVASLEADEMPYPEYYRVPEVTARLINEARNKGKRTVAVGTTSVRAIETVTDNIGRVNPGEGWTNLVIKPGRELRSINGLLTGFHEPRSSHLGILTALAGREHVHKSYRVALEKGYLWHEFGDLHLILP